jgi:hypothetical protein
MMTKTKKIRAAKAVKKKLTMMRMMMMIATTMPVLTKKAERKCKARHQLAGPQLSPRA